MEDLATHRFVNYVGDPVLLAQNCIVWSRLPIPLTANFRSSSILAQQIAVNAGAGLAILPQFLAHNQPNLEQVLAEQSALHPYLLDADFCRFTTEPRIKLVWDYLRKQNV